MQRPPCYINNSAVEYVDRWPHFGHVISSDMDDKNDINRGRSALIRLIMSRVSLVSLIVLPKCDCLFLIVTVYTVALFGTLPMFMLSKSVVHGELACVAFVAFRLILTIC